MTARTSDDADHAADRAVIDRLHRLRVVLPALAQDAAAARREAARLRRENARLLSRLAELEASRAEPNAYWKSKGTQCSSTEIPAGRAI